MTEALSPAASPSTASRSKALGWIITIPYLLVFFGILCAYHLPIAIVHRVTGRFPRKVLESMCRAICRNLAVTAGVRFIVRRPERLPAGPIIVVANHQGMYDIPLMISVLPELDLNFVSKRELGRGIPSISYSLRHMGSVLIDRKDAAQAVESIREFGRAIGRGEMNGSIFPEGTRAREGTMKRFKAGGLCAMLENAPGATVVPVVIDGSWEILRYNFRPVPYGAVVHLEVLDPIKTSEQSPAELATLIESRIKAAQQSIRAEIAR